MCDEIKPVKSRLVATNELFMSVLADTEAKRPYDRVFIDALKEFIPLVLARVIDGGATEDAEPIDTIIGLLQAFATCAALLLHYVEDKDGIREELANAFVRSFELRMRAKHATEQSDSKDDSDASVSSEAGDVA